MFQKLIAQMLNKKFNNFVEQEDEIPHYYSVLYCEKVLSELKGDFFDDVASSAQNTKFRDVLAEVLCSYDKQFKKLYQEHAQKEKQAKAIKDYIVLLYRELYLAQYAGSDLTMPIDEPIDSSSIKSESKLAALTDGKSNWNEIKISDIQRFIFSSDEIQFRVGNGETRYKELLANIGKNHKSAIDQFCFDAGALDKTIGNWISGRSNISGSSGNQKNWIELFAALENKYQYFSQGERKCEDTIMRISILRYRLSLSREVCMLYMRSIEDVCIYQTIVNKKTYSYYVSCLDDLKDAVRRGVIKSLPSNLRDQERLIGQIREQLYVDFIKSKIENRTGRIKYAAGMNNLQRQIIDRIGNFTIKQQYDVKTVIHNSITYNYDSSTWSKLTADEAFDFSGIDEVPIEDIYTFVCFKINEKIYNKSFTDTINAAAKKICKGIHKKTGRDCQSHEGDIIDLITENFRAVTFEVIQRKQSFIAETQFGSASEITPAVTDKIATYGDDFDRIKLLVVDSPYFFVLKGHLTIYKEALYKMSYKYYDRATSGSVLNVCQQEFDVCRSNKREIAAAAWLRSLIQRTIDSCAFDVKKWRSIMNLQGYSVRKQQGDQCDSSYEYKVSLLNELYIVGEEELERTSNKEKAEQMLLLLRNLFIGYYCESHDYAVDLNMLDKELVSIGFLPLYRGQDARNASKFDYFIQRAVDYANSHVDDIVNDLVARADEQAYLNFNSQFYSAYSV